MISFEEAYSIVTTNLPLTDAERIDYRNSAGRILAEDILSDIHMPPFDKAAVDGYACRMTDIHQPMRLLEVIPAGSKPSLEITPGTCSKIMTGAMMPDGADCVVMVEQTREENEIVFVTETRTKANIAFFAEDIKAGDKVISKGTLIKPQHIAVLATAGAISPLVFKKARITVMSTGDELVEPHVVPGPGKIRNSNSSQLVAQAIAMGADAEYGGIIADNEDSSRQMISNALEKSDVVILSGGISMGDFDYVPAILNEMGIEILFRSVAVQPGKPSVFARSGNKFVFALPGNPVSSFNIFELLAKPFLYRLMGHNYDAVRLLIPIGEDYLRKAIARHGFVPAIINSHGRAMPVHYHGSAHINALVQANALISVPLGVASFNKGDLVDVRLI
jgi:molybdopterin molybdotransferase